MQTILFQSPASKTESECAGADTAKVLANTKPKEKQLTAAAENAILQV